MDQVAGDIEIETTIEDPRTVLARWANRGDEWVRYLVGQVLSTGRPVADSAWIHRWVGAWRECCDVEMPL